jgi:acylphosphatase
MTHCLKIIVQGRVQGVFFRAYTQDEAQARGLTGWVRNLPGGEVEALICGEARDVERMTLWFKKGSPRSRVDEVLINKIEIPDDLPAKFEIRY